MRIVERYIFREVLQAWVGVTLVLLIILLSNQLATVLSRAASGGFSGSVVLILLWLTSLEQLVVLVPIGLFLAIMLALGRLYHESELTAMQACGLGNRALLRPILILAVLAAALLAWLAFQVVPQSAQQAMDIRSQALREARFARLEPGKFRSFGGNSDMVFYAESVDDQEVLHNIYAERAVGQKLEIWTARRAVQRGIGEQQQTFVLYDGERYEGIPGSNEFRIIEFAEGGIPISLPEVGGYASRRDMQPTLKLLGSADAQDRAELQRRLSTPLMALVLAVLAVPLSRLRPRQGRYARVGYFILVYLFYSGLLVVAGDIMVRGKIPQWLGMWWVHAVGLLLALLMWWRGNSLRWWPQRQLVKA
ncbi:MAG: LPS export ABC transporter permease LptF [Steroidobacteraceae bacterium]